MNTLLKAFALTLLGGAAGQAVAQSGASEPVTFIKLYANGGMTDSHIGLSVDPQDVFQGTLQSQDGDVLTAVGNPGWADGQFAGSGQTYSILIVTGELEGATFQISANTAGTLTVDSGHEDLDLVSTVAAEGQGDLFLIFPDWNPATVFENSNIADQSTLFVYDNMSGINASPVAILRYFAGFGWYDDQFQLADFYRLTRGFGLILRTPAGSEELVACLASDLPMNKGRHIVKTLSDGGANDVSFVIMTPDPLLLAESGLADDNKSKMLFGFDNADININKAPSIQLTYFPDVGWMDDEFQPVDPEFALQPYTRYLLRVGPEISESVSFWCYLPVYLN